MECTEEQVSLKIAELDARVKNTVINGFDNIITNKIGYQGKLFNLTSPYVVGDILSDGTDIYICILASTGNAISNTTYFTKIVATDSKDFNAATKWAVLKGNTILASRGVISAAFLISGKNKIKITFDANVSVRAQYLTYNDLSIVKLLPEYDQYVVNSYTYREYMGGSHYQITAGFALNEIVITPAYYWPDRFGTSYNPSLDVYYANPLSAIVANEVITILLCFDPTT